MPKNNKISDNNGNVASFIKGLLGTSVKKTTFSRIGLAGDGAMLCAMAAAYKKCHLAESITIFHPDTEKAGSLAEQTNIKNYTSDFSRFVESVDAAEVFPSPGADSAALAIKLLEAGKHVSLQKPFARSLEEADSLIRASGKSGAFLRVNEYFLFYEPYQKLKKMINDRVIGEVCAARFHVNLVGRGGWGAMPELLEGDSPLFHPVFDRFAMAVDLLGGIESINAYINPMKKDAGGQGIVGFKYKAAGCYGCFDLTYAPDTTIRSEGFPCDDTIEVAGTDGIIWLNHFHGKMAEEPWLEVRRGKKHYTEGIGSGMKLEWSDCLNASAKDFLECIGKGTGPKYSAPEARRSLRLLLAAIESSKSNLEVKV